MAVNNKTLEDFLRKLSYMDFVTFGADAESFRIGFNCCQAAVQKWREDNACNHDNARVPSHKVGVAAAEHWVYKTYDFCPDCGKDLRPDGKREDDVTDDYATGDPIFEHGGERATICMKVLNGTSSTGMQREIDNCKWTSFILRYPGDAYIQARAMFCMLRELERRRLENG